MHAGHNTKRDTLTKRCVQRHGHASKRSYNAAEKATEARVRREGKRQAAEREDESR